MVIATQTNLMDLNLSILAEITNKLDKCADCLSPSNLFWVVINRGVIICNKCAAVHRTLGRHISIIKCLYYPLSSLPLPNNYWTDIEFEMVKYFVNASKQINDFWEGGSNKIKFCTNSIRYPDFIYDSHFDAEMDKNILPKISNNNYHNKKDSKEISKSNLKKLNRTLSRSRNLLLPKPRFAGKSSVSFYKKKVSRAQNAPRFKQESSESDEEICQDHSDNVHRFSIHFKENPLFSYGDRKRCSLNRADFIRAKYQLLAYVREEDKPDVRNPKEAFNNLNTLLENAVQGPKLEISLIALALGADPNYANKLKQSMSLLAILAGQELQYLILNLWGANHTTLMNITKSFDLHPSMVKLHKILHYIVIDKIKLFINSYIPNKNYIYSVLNGNKYSPDSETIDSPPFTIGLKNISNLADSTFTHLLQDLYEEIDRREIEMIHDLMTMNNNCDNTTSASLPCLPINPDLSSIRNGRQKLARISDETLIQLLKVTLGDFARRDSNYVRHVLSSTTNQPIQTPLCGPKARGDLNVSKLEHVQDGFTREIASRLDAQQSTIEDLCTKTAHLDGEAMLNRRELSALKRTVENTELECKNTNALLKKILSTIEFSPRLNIYQSPSMLYENALEVRDTDTANHVYATVNKRGTTSQIEENGDFNVLEGTKDFQSDELNREVPSNTPRETCSNDETCKERFEPFVSVLTERMKLILKEISNLGQLSNRGSTHMIDLDRGEVRQFSRSLGACHDTMTNISSAVEEATRALYPEITRDPGWNSLHLEEFETCWKDLIFSTTKLQIALNAVTTSPSESIADEQSQNIALDHEEKCFDSNAFIDESLNLVRTLKALSDLLNGNNAFQQNE